MSYDGPHIARRALLTNVSRVVQRCCRTVLARLRAVTFWLAVGLPWLLLAFTVGGYAGSNPEVFAGLLSVTVLCGVAGREHGR